MISGRAPRIKRKQLIKMIVNPEPLTYDSVKNILSLLRKEYDFAGYEVFLRNSLCLRFSGTAKALSAGHPSLYYIQFTAKETL